MCPTCPGTKWTTQNEREFVEMVAFLSPLLFVMRFLSSLWFIDDFDSGVIRASPSCHLIVTWSHA